MSSNLVSQEFPMIKLKTHEQDNQRKESSAEYDQESDDLEY